MSKTKVSSPRNQPCSCGSGKKYKNCCLKKYEEQAKRHMEAWAKGETYTPILDDKQDGEEASGIAFDPKRQQSFEAFLKHRYGQ